MRPATLPLLILVFAAGAVPARAADLSKIERTIAKEPAYGDKPQYVLLVFGAEAKSRVWLVRDGKTLYVDRNGNGDLTEEGNRLSLTKPSLSVGALTIGAGQTRYSLEINWMRRPPAGVKGPCWTLEVQGKYEYRVGRDANGYLLAGERPQDAPIVHLDGRLGLEVCSYCGSSSGQLVRDPVGSELGVSIGTPGLGKGTFAYLVPAPDNKMKLLTEVEFLQPDAAKKHQPVKLSLSRDSECCSFAGAIEVPEGATRARVTMSAPDGWKGDKLPSVTREIPVVEAKSRR
jgi:hypothetical protein